MATIKQKTAARLIFDNMLAKNPASAGKLLDQAGYGKVSKQPSRILESAGFKETFNEYLATLDDKVIIRKWYQWALSDKDKRVSLDAGEKILKLKGRFPKDSIDIELSKKREDIIEPD